jgi:hypothetical protein
VFGWLTDREWPKTAKEAANRFRQGHVLRWTSIAYGADFANAICRPTADTRGSGKGFVKIDEAFSYVILTSQTCDLCEDGRKNPKFPFITVAPVYDIRPLLTNKGDEKQIRKLGFSYLFPLTAAQFSGNGELWVADLRAHFCLEKGDAPIFDTNG